MSQSQERRLTLFFTDGSKLGLSFQKQGGDDPATLAGNVRKALEAEKLSFEIDGDLFVVPMRNVQYVQVSPAPEALPPGVFRGVRIVS